MTYPSMSFRPVSALLFLFISCFTGLSARAKNYTCTFTRRVNAVDSASSKFTAAWETENLNYKCANPLGIENTVCWRGGSDSEISVTATKFVGSVTRTQGFSTFTVPGARELDLPNLFQLKTLSIDPDEVRQKTELILSCTS